MDYIPIDGVIPLQAPSHQWYEPEQKDQCSERMKAVVDQAAKERGTSTLLVSHGGPTSRLYPQLTGEESSPPVCQLYMYMPTLTLTRELLLMPRPVLTPTSPAQCGYTSLFCYVPCHHTASETGYKALIVADHDHLKEVPEGSHAGPNDRAEQQRVAELQRKSDLLQKIMTTI